MNVVELLLPTINKFSSAYLRGEEKILRFFTYNPHSKYTYEARKEHLKTRTYRRTELAAYLQDYNKTYQADSATMQNITRLTDEDALVVIGGQQAGLMTGPLYTISKIVSIIKLAKEQEKQLGVPVIPVFWIAGEDHDFQEVNHVYSPKHTEMEKLSFSIKGSGKKMVSDLSFDKEAMEKWVKEVIKAFGETEYTNDVIAHLETAIHDSNNIVDFFAYIITSLFKGTGLVLVNASDSRLRKIETPFFQEMLNNHEKITSGILQSQQELNELGFNPLLEVDEDSMNLFYHQNGERELIYRSENGSYALSKHSNWSISIEELHKLIEEYPEKFSNNVVTRPLMQELLFPTLAFIGGPGEISYWAELKRCFESLYMEMPPVVSRISLSFLERDIESAMQDIEESLQDILMSGLEEKKKAWLNQEELHQMNENLSNFQQQYGEVHKKFREVGNAMEPHLEHVFEKNWRLIDRQFDFIQRLIERSAYEKHEHIMKKFEKVELALRPGKMPQERVWNIYYFINKYGMDFVQRLCELPLDHNGKHKVIRL
ncbi:bacillithiol biosynthesis cysteine-adding enzyme BshC [Sutcliffiella rhizosphaerae]|uniref:Putative cysteine ligase BshC n=1 Tax=Sutcliffiella rhizosphaerae TaxID=2880967 RepID=A0ABM8YJ32_9BACI|nr:bacillithiol biosynthesis cysteine-adding enzyme BshC [Sutcliffiella rhizosphaerae]CAG9619812.1 Putative cysteine ligase BshC [Sutcliffiella rhizosphaerae]